MTPNEMLLERVRDGFRTTNGEEAIAVFAAPGRVNLIGEHTDYNAGLVLPCAIDRSTMIAIGPESGNSIETVALDFRGARDSFELEGGVEPIGIEWCDHVRGVAHYLQQNGIKVAPAQMAIAGNVPMGAGLSSSASLGVAIALALSKFAGTELTKERLAQIAQKAENTFVRTQCGIMDQMASACSREGHALLLDCRDLSYSHIAMPEDLALVVIDSGVRHSLGNSPYNERRAQCEAAAAHYQVQFLRDLTPDQLESGPGGLGEVEYRRARHVVTEIERVREFTSALADGASEKISALMEESFVSYRDDFGASLPEIDRLFDLASSVLGNSGGVRLTGGGFGGSLIAIAAPDVVSDLAKAVAPCDVSVFQASQGAHQVF